jgi:hypothetical protein
MKKITLLLFLLVVSMFTTLHAQNTTYYGENTGTLGWRGSYFGKGAGGSLIFEDPTATRYLDNSFFGYYCGFRTIGQQNTAMGSVALFENTTGEGNVAIGFNAQYYNTTGHSNTAVGSFSLEHNTTAAANVAIGASTLQQNTTGFRNTAIGSGASYANTTGFFNVAAGDAALSNNVIGAYNVAIGTEALLNNTGSTNTATGYRAAYETTTGVWNAAFGSYALRHNVNGILNTAIGYGSGPSSTLPDLVNSTALGAVARPTGPNQVRIGNSSITSIGGKVSWSTFSDGRFKKDIKEDVTGLQFINQLRPVSYIVDNESINKFLGIPDSIRTQLSKAENAPKRQTGFIAQEVENIIKKTGYAFDGVEVPQSEHDHYSIRYAEFVVPLVKAVQELTAKVEMQRKSRRGTKSRN